MAEIEILIFETIDSIKSRPNFLSPIDIKSSNDERFDRIVGPYHIKGEKILCGISSCRTPNLHGVVIALRDGTETNVGKDCGAGHFNAEFSVELKRHNALYNRYLKQNRVRALKSHPEKLERLIKLCEEYTAYKSKRLSLRGTLDRGQDARLTQMGRKKDGRIFRHETIKGKELEAYYETNPAAKRAGIVPTNEILLGEILGVAFFGTTHRDEEILNLVAPMKQIFASSDEEIASWKERELNAAHRLVGSIDQEMDKLETLLEQGRKFFERDNLDRLSLIGIAA